MKRAGIMLVQIIVTAAGVWYVFHDPQRRAQIAGALRHADFRWVFLGWICYSAVELLATVRWQILLRIQGVRISWLRAGAIVMIGLFFNQFLPGGLGGDAMRLYFIFKRADKKNGRNAFRRHSGGHSDDHAAGKHHHLATYFARRCGRARNAFSRVARPPGPCSPSDSRFHRFTRLHQPDFLGPGGRCCISVLKKDIESLMPIVVS